MPGMGTDDNKEQPASIDTVTRTVNLLITLEVKCLYRGKLINLLPGKSYMAPEAINDCLN